MEVTAPSGSASARRRSRSSVVAATLALSGAVLVVPATAGAEQTIRFDGAGDAPHVSLIGDSTLAGVRWYSDYGALQRFNFVLDAESCRRTLEQSCISREGFRSDTVVETIGTLSDELGDVLVVMTGYNDPEWAIDESIAAVTDAARSGGVDQLVWLSLRMGSDVAYSDPQEQSSVDTFKEYNEQLVAAAKASDGFLQIADWATYSTGASSWFETDGVHLTGQGVDAVTVFIAGILDRVLAGEDVSPAAAPWAVLVPGDEGDVVAEVQSALIDAGIDLRGGADGVFGNGTMAAVATYQRREDLQVTGAVDAATAESLGVYDATPEEATPAAEAATSTTAPASTPTTVTDSPASVVPTESASNANFRTVALMAGVVVAVVVALVVARRRHVVQSRGRRTASAQLPTGPYDHLAEELHGDVASGGPTDDDLWADRHHGAPLR